MHVILEYICPIYEQLIHQLSLASMLLHFKVASMHPYVAMRAGVLSEFEATTSPVTLSLVA